ncbi:hypothetical protein PsorP6_014649 [Peronosclerospora sorghi]|uniref:Uncharacterized protein n=1 Tax=Peronosclerospora sorghi TaxID=230839 RepID=A0ACC0VT60_9STRA|nr:hypothetical protein PsorP6_014649 [Peronosclerospora sorghi]
MCGQDPTAPQYLIPISLHKPPRFLSSANRRGTPLLMPKKGLITPFQRGHEAQFGLVVTERDEATSAVRAVTCQFCLKFGREANPSPSGSGRRTHGLLQIRFVLMCTRDAMRMHTLRDGPSSNRSKPINHASTLLAHLDSHGALTLKFNRYIVEKVIDDLLFDVDDESIHITRARALHVFKLHEDALPEDNADVYSVKIESVLRFKMVLGFVSKRESFRSASRFVDVANAGQRPRNCSAVTNEQNGLNAVQYRIQALDAIDSSWRSRIVSIGPLSEEDIDEADLAVPHVRREEYMVAYADAMIFIRDQDLFDIDSLEALSPRARCCKHSEFYCQSARGIVLWHQRGLG